MPEKIVLMLSLFNQSHPKCRIQGNLQSIKPSSVTKVEHLEKLRADTIGLFSIDNFGNRYEKVMITKKFDTCRCCSRKRNAHLINRWCLSSNSYSHPQWTASLVSLEQRSRIFEWSSHALYIWIWYTNSHITAIHISYKSTSRTCYWYSQVLRKDETRCIQTST